MLQVWVFLMAVFIWATVTQASAFAVKAFIDCDFSSPVTSKFPSTAPLLSPVYTILKSFFLPIVTQAASLTISTP